MNVRINWDMDGVLAQLSEVVLEEYNRRYQDDLTVDDLRTFHISKHPRIRCESEEIWEIIAEVDYAQVPSYPDLVKVARHFADRGIPSSVVSSLTWYPPNTHATTKREWVKQFLGDDFVIIFTKDKHWCCRSHRDVLIDDKGATIAKWPGQGVLLERPWNRDERPIGVETVAPEDLYQRLMELTG
jgi:5'(3')-deoxyribonucleotidase